MISCAKDCKDPATARRITLCGSVQGKGIRPTVARLARASGLRGGVRNDTSGVIIEACGESQAVERFLQQLPGALPAGAVVAQQETIDDPLFASESEFAILTSSEQGSIRTIVPLDRVVCEACLQETKDSGDRRYAYPFTNCTLCGPRYSILHSMPFDRGRTSMSPYSMCDDCQREYNNPQSRRFHSQTNCCPACGPRLWSTDANGNDSSVGQDAIDAAVASIRSGKIVALKGIGGYQLICDATDQSAVVRLRRRKGRPSKPLALMVRDLSTAERLVQLSLIEREAMTSPAGPIVIARSRGESTLARSINRGFADLGIMLPTTALHSLLLQSADVPLVVTSGNAGDQPIEYREQQAALRLADVADRFLHHDREIVRPIDDSVVRCIDDRVVTIRAGRGIAPVCLDLPSSPSAVAVGGQQKVAVAVANGHQVALGPHIGDLDSVACRERFAEQTESLCRLYRCEPEVYLHDQHPDYWTSRFVEGHSHQSTQHHHAHIVAAMAERGWLERTVLGLAYDGTGLGSDNTIWGGEILIASVDQFERVGHLRPFPLVGGEAAIRDPARVGLALIRDALGAQSTAAGDLLGLDRSHCDAMLALIDRPQMCPMTSSIGRLFDGVAAIALPELSCSFEGEPAMLLEAACDESDQQAYELRWTEDSPLQLDWRPLIRQLIDDRRRGVDAGRIAMRFHRGLARAVVGVIERFAELPIVISGGVFQNRRLVELITADIPDQRELSLSSLVPPNDGGLAIGQLAIATTTESSSRRQPCA